MAKPGDHARTDRPRLARSNSPAIYFDDRDNFGGRSGEETFIGDKYIVASNIGFNDFEAELRGNLEDDPTRNSAQCAGGNRRRENVAALDDEDIVGGAFSDLTAGLSAPGLVRRVAQVTTVRPFWYIASG